MTSKSTWEKPFLSGWWLWCHFAGQHKSHCSTTLGVNISLNQAAEVTKKTCTFCVLKGRHRQRRSLTYTYEVWVTKTLGLWQLFSGPRTCSQCPGSDHSRQSKELSRQWEDKCCRYKTAFRCSSNCCPDSMSTSLLVLFLKAEKVSEHSFFKHRLHLTQSDYFSGERKL